MKKNITITKQFIFVLICLLFWSSNILKSEVNILNYKLQGSSAININFLLTDNINKLIIPLSQSEVRLQQAGINCNITDFKQAIVPTETHYNVICFDLAIGSRTNNNNDFKTAQKWTNELISYINTDISSHSLLSFSSIPSQECKFDEPLTNLANVVDGVQQFSVSSMYNAFFQFSTGAFDIFSNSQTLNAKKSVLLITQGILSNDDTELIIAKAKELKIAINILYIHDIVPSNIQRLCDETGGYILTSSKVMQGELSELAAFAGICSGITPYSLTADLGLFCDEIIPLTLLAQIQSIRFEIDNTADILSELVSQNTEGINFPSVFVGESLEKEAIFNAKNATIHITGISTTNPFSISNIEPFTPTVSNPIILNNNDELKFLIKFTPTDSAITFAKLIIETNACKYDTLYLTGGFPNIPPKTKTIDIIKPDCNDVLVIGDSIDINWRGVLLSDVVSIVEERNGLLDTFARNIVGLRYGYFVEDKGEDSTRFIINQMWPNNVGRTLDFKHDMVVNMAFFNNYENKILSVSSNFVRIWSAYTGELLQTLPEFTSNVMWAKYSPTNTATDKYIGVASMDSTAYLFDANNFSLKWKFKTGNQFVNSIEFSPDGKYAVITNNAGYIYVINVETGLEYSSIRLRVGDCKYAQFSPKMENGKYEFMAFSSWEGIIHFFDLDCKQFDSIDMRAKGVSTGQSNYATYNHDGSKIAFIHINISAAQIVDRITHNILATIQHSVIDPSLNNLINFAAFSNPTEDAEEYLLTSANDNTLCRWNMDGTLSPAPNKFIEHKFRVNTGVFSKDGWRVLSSSNDNLAKIWNLDQKTLQADTTCYLSIEYAKAKIADTLNFGLTYIGNFVIRTFDSAIINICDFPYNIKALRIVGENATEFGIADEIDYPMDFAAMGKLNLNIVFSPQTVGNRTAQIEIIIPNDTLYITLTGTGIKSRFQAITGTIDFGNIYIDDYKDIIVPLCKNISGSDIEITDLYITGANNITFQLLSYYINKNGEVLSTPFTIQDGDTLYCEVRGIPYDAGMKNAIFNMIYTAKDDNTIQTFPDRWNMLANGISLDDIVLNVSIKDMSGDISNIVNCPIYTETLFNGKPINVPANINNIYFDLLFNGRIIYPQTFSDEVKILNTTLLEDGYKLLEMSIPYKPGNQIIDGLQFVALWGNDSVTKINLINGRTNSEMRINIVGNDAIFKITNIYDGILFDEKGNVASLGQNKPNPATNYTKIDYEVLEAGNHKLSIYNIDGGLYNTIFDEYKTCGTYSITIPLDEMPLGTYFYILETPTQRFIKQMIHN